VPLSSRYGTDMDAPTHVEHGVAALLNPRNVVLVGASDRPGHWSHRVWLNLRRFGFPGRVLPVNPNRAEIWGERCFPTLQDLPEAPDHLAIFVPADTTLDVLEAGARLGARSATLFAAGFGEGGDDEGRQRAERLRRVLARTGLAVAGPNCMGIASGRSKLVTIADESLQEPAPGPVAVITQSGMMCSTINRAINDLGLTVAHLISCGNQTGLGIGDYIDFFADDPEVRVILCYIESVHDAGHFLSAARKARARGKAVVAVKIGGSEAARSAALAHTGSLAGSLEVFDAFARDAGIVRLDSMEDAIEAVEFLARSPAPRGRNVAAMTISGALRSLMTDAAPRCGVTLAPLSDETRARLKSVLGADADIGNPLDTKRTLPTEQYIGCLEALSAAPEVDAVLVAEELPREAGIARKIANLTALEAWVARTRSERGDAFKPVAMFSALTLSETDYMRSVRQQLGNVPLLRDTGKALRVLGAITAAGCSLGDTSRLATQSGGSSGKRPALSAARWRALAARLREPAALSETDSKRLLEAYGIAAPPERVVRTAEEAVAAAEEIGFPVVLKGISATIAHKSDAGLVALNRTDAVQVAETFTDLMNRGRSLGAALDGMLVAKQISDGIETVLGIHRDPEMGPVLMFGMGGVWLELFKDVAFAPPDADRARALEMIETTRVSRLLKGYRGSPPADTEALVSALVALGRLAVDCGDILESVDINPFLVRNAGYGAYALDGLVVLRPPEGAIGD
jgi:acetate---CoA ligase (ADP-forming)